MYFFKINKSYRDVVAICDSNLIGRKFESEGFQLDVKENFFKGGEADEKTITKIMKDMSMEDATFNIVGEKSINVALKAGIISKNGIKKINNIPFALVLV